MTENSAITNYFNRLAKIDLLTRDEEHELFCKFKAGDESARNEIIERNLRLVIPTAKAYAKCGIPFSDLVQEGSIAVTAAVEKFDVSLGNKFSTYATYWIKQRIGRYVKKHCKNVFVPEHIMNLAIQINKAKRKFAQENDTEEYNEADIVNVLKADFGVDTDVRTVKETIDFCQSETSMSAKIGEDNDAEFGDLIEDTLADDPAAEAEANMITTKLNSVFIDLTSEERMILTCRYGIGVTSNMTPLKIAKMFGISKEDVIKSFNATVKNETISVIAV